MMISSLGDVYFIYELEEVCYDNDDDGVWVKGGFGCIFRVRLLITSE
jgi:hypothetical protein